MTVQDGWKSRMQLNHTFLDAYWQQNDCQGVRDGGLSEKPDERCDILLFYVKQPIDTDGSIPINAKKVYSRMIIDGTNNRSWWIFTPKNAMDDRTLVDYPCRKMSSHDECFLRIQVKDMNLDDYRWNKRLIMIDVYS